MKNGSLDLIKKYYLTLIIAIATIVLCVCMIAQIRSDDTYSLIMEKCTYNEDGSFSGPFFSLPAGNYVLKIDYSSNNDMVINVLDDELILNESNLPSDNQTLEVPFAIGNATDLFCFTVYGGEGESAGISGVTLHRTDGLLYTDHIYLAFLVLVIGAAIIFYTNTKRWKDSPLINKIDFLIVTITGTLFGLPLFIHDVIPRVWDNWGHMLRIESIKDAFLMKQFPVMVLPKAANGFGQMGALYPLIPLYPAGILRMFNVSMKTSYASLMFFLIVGSGVSMYISAKLISKNEYASTLAAVLYILAPYHFVDVYSRSALGEVVALVFVPIAIAGLYEVFFGDVKKYWYVMVLGYTGVINSHVVSIFVLALLSLIFGMICLGRIIKEKRYLYLIKSLVYVLLLNMWYLIPFFTYFNGGTNKGSTYGDILKARVPVTELFSNIAQGSQGVIGWVGLGCIILGIAGVIVLVVKKEEECSSDSFACLMLVLGVFFIWIETYMFPWDLLAKVPKAIEVLNLIQFPFRFLIIGVPVMIISTSHLIIRAVDLIIKKHADIYKYVFILIMAVWSVSCFASFLSYLLTRPDYDYDVLYGGIRNVTLAENYPEDADESCIMNTSWYPYSYEMQIPSYEKNGNTIDFIYVTTNEDDYVDFPIFYFKGYTAKVIGGDVKAGTKLDISRGVEGRIRVQLPQSVNGTAVHLSFTGLWYFKVGYIISLIAIVLFVLDIKGKGLRKNHNK